MKPSKEWFDTIIDCPDSNAEFAPISKAMIRLIQSDALEHAANILEANCGPKVGDWTKAYNDLKSEIANLNKE